MIEVEILENSSGQTVGIKAEGHSGKSKSGQDIFCAAVSTVFDLLTKGSEGLPAQSISFTRNPEIPKWSIRVHREHIESIHWQSYYRLIKSARRVLEDLSEKHSKFCDLKIIETET